MEEEKEVEERGRMSNKEKQQLLDFKKVTGPREFHLYIPLSCINTGVIPKSLHTSIWAKPHQPKKSHPAMMPVMVRISNRVL